MLSYKLDTTNSKLISGHFPKLEKKGFVLLTTQYDSNGIAGETTGSGSFECVELAEGALNELLEHYNTSWYSDCIRTSYLKGELVEVEISFPHCKHARKVTRIGLYSEY